MVVRSLLEVTMAIISISLIVIAVISFMNNAAEAGDEFDTEINGVGLIVSKQPVNGLYVGKPHMAITVVNERATEFLPKDITINATLSNGEIVSGYITMKDLPVEPASRQMYLVWFNTTTEADIVSVRWGDGDQHVNLPTVTRFSGS